MKVLVIDDEQSQREILADILGDEGYEVITASDGGNGLKKIYQGEIFLVLTDLKMPEIDGLTVLKETLQFNPDIQVILMTAFGTIPSAVNAMKNGAYDYLTKPFQKEDLLRVIKRATEKVRLVTENRRLKSEMDQRYSYRNLVGGSPEMREVYRLIERIKDVDATVLITGESGTGKELVARAVHFSGKRKDGPFVTLNCGAIPENLIESELFGHEKGAFTGASRNREGKFEQADGGTIFLDEIGTMPPALQIRLLRVLQEKTVQKVGGSASIDLDVRVIAATNEDLEEKIREQQFRPDLYHRLNVFTIHLSPLRERSGDIPLLASHFLKKLAERYNRPQPSFDEAALSRLEQYHYPGNVRELENIIEKTVLMTESEKITADLLMIPRSIARFASARMETDTALPDMEKQMITEAMKQQRGSIKNAAKLLGISYKTLQYRLNKYELRKEDFK